MALQAKASSPQPTEDDLRSTKKVRIRSDGEEAGSGKSSEETDVVMEERVPKAGISYRDKATTETRKWERARSYRRFSRGGPWMVYGAYLTVQPWSLEFDAKTGAISKVVAWIRILGLSIRYYHKSTLRAIGALLGNVVKIDYMTEVDGTPYHIEYEGLPHICFACGKYGHSKERCGVQAQMSDGVRSPVQNVSGASPSPIPHGVANPNLDAGGKPMVNSSPYGSWMMVKYPKKGNNLYRGKEANSGDLVMKAGSRFNVLYDCEDISPPSALADKKEPMENGKLNDQILLASPSNQGKIGSGQHNKKLDARSRPTSNGTMPGLLKQAQEYRPKAVVSGKTSSSPESKDGVLQVPAKPKAIACGSGVCPEKVPNPVGALSRHDENGMVGVVGPIAQGSGLVPIKTSSSLEESNHTVMILKQSRRGHGINNGSD
ncbi:hypothetical protein K1719_026500 [Acacia pycnantha]|nr:hypothetical protein K1719_026500 [Acacia pycnantha]